jgi:hypothetical protein
MAVSVAVLTYVVSRIGLQRKFVKGRRNENEVDHAIHDRCAAAVEP